MLIEYEYRKVINPDYIVSAEVIDGRVFTSDRFVEVVEFIDYNGCKHKYRGTMEEFLELINGGQRK